MAIIAAFKNGSTKVYTKSVHQFDKGQKLIVTGVALPDKFEVHVSNSKDEGIATAYTGDAEGVFIPDAYFATGDYVYVWIYAVSKEEINASDVPNDESAMASGITIEEGTSIYEIVIPVIQRPINLQISQMGHEETVAGYVVDEDHTLIPVKQ